MSGFVVFIQEHYRDQKALTYSNHQSMSCPTDTPVNAIVNVILLFQGEE